MRINLGLDRFSGLYLLALMIVIFSLWAPQTFPTTDTLHILASTQAISAIVALALLVPMATGQFDLSVGAVAIVAGVTATLLQTKGIAGPVQAVVIALGVSVLIGCINAFVIIKLRVNSFIATLGMTSILAAVVAIITDSGNIIPVRPGFFQDLTQTTVFGFQAVIVYLFVIAIILWWFMERTPAGRYMRATGAAPEAARLTGIRVDLWSWVSLMISAAIAGLAGILYVSMTAPSPGFGDTLLLPAFAAVFLGSTQLSPGKLNVWGTLVAIFVLATGVQGLQLVTGVTWVASMFNGVALIAAVALALGRERRIASGRGQKRGSVKSDDSPPDDTLLLLDQATIESPIRSPGADD